MAEAGWAKSYIPGGTKDDYVRLDKQGMKELLTSPAIAAGLERRMRRVQATIPGSELEVRRTGHRAAAKVIYGSDYDEANTGRLSRALDLAGGQRGTKVRTRKSRRK